MEVDRQNISVNLYQRTTVCESTGDVSLALRRFLMVEIAFGCLIRFKKAINFSTEADRFYAKLAMNEATTNWKPINNAKVMCDLY